MSRGCHEPLQFHLNFIEQRRLKYKVLDCVPGQAELRKHRDCDRIRMQRGRLFEDLRLAGESRRLRRLRLRERYLQSAAAAAHLFDRAEHDAREIALAMRSRGFFQPDSADDAQRD